MIAVETIFSASQLPDNLDSIATGLERRIPLGAGGKNEKITSTARRRIERLESSAKVDYRHYAGWQEQLGTLGSGNHFVEVCLDETQQVWLVLHSGLRGVGNRIAGHHIKIAQKLMQLRRVPLKDRDLAYLPEETQEFRDYIRDLLWSQDYALANREEMMDRAMTELSVIMHGEIGHEQAMTRQRINCHHNFTQLETHYGKADVDHPQGSDSNESGATRRHSRFHGHSQLHRIGAWKPRVVSVGSAWSGTADVADEGSRDVYHEGS
jgi:tRNA-splicing ligase RtcB